MNPLIAFANELLEAQRWPELLSELERLEASGALASSPVIIRATVVGMRADALEGLGDIPGALQAVVDSLAIHRSGALHYAEFVLRHAIGDHYQRAESSLSETVGPLTEADVASMNPTTRLVMAPVIEASNELRKRRAAREAGSS